MDEEERKQEKVKSIIKRKCPNCNSFVRIIRKRDKYTNPIIQIIICDDCGLIEITDYKIKKGDDLDG